MLAPILLLAALVPPLASTEVAAIDDALKIDQRVEHYDIHATTRRELKAGLRKALRAEDGADGSEARTRQTITSRYELEPLANGCRLKGLQVTLESVIRLPRWISPEEDPPAKLEAAWDSLLAALTVHEQGHRELAIAAGHELVGKLRALNEAQDCQTLDRDARRALFQVTLQHSIRDRAYERRTRNGAAQGVIL